jgi:hypothetical protein
VPVFVGFVLDDILDPQGEYGPVGVLLTIAEDRRAQERTLES